MKKFLLIGCLLMALMLLMPGVALASYDYYIPIEVYNNDSEASSGIPVLVTLNNSQLAALGYINASGLDTDLQEGSASRSYMVADSRLGFLIPSIEGYQTRTFNYRLGESPEQGNFSVVLGDEGYFDITDHADLELGNNFSIEYEGWMDTGITNTIFISKHDALRVYTQAEDTLRAAILSGSTSTGAPTQVPNGVGASTVIASVTGSATHWGAVSDSSDASYVHTTSTSYQRDLYQLEDSDSSLHGYLIDSVAIYFRISRRTAMVGSADATPLFRIGSTVYSGTEQSQGSTVWSTKTESFDTSPATSTRWTWAEIDSMQIGIDLKRDGSEIAACSEVYIVVSYALPTEAKTVTIPITSGGYLVEVWADGTNFGIDIDGVTENSTALAGVSVPDNGNDWVVRMPYMDYYEHSVNGSSEAWFLPITMVQTTVLTDRSGNGHHGTITWGSSPGSIEVSIGGLQPYSAYVAPGAEDDEIPQVLPTPGTISPDATAGVTGEGLPMQAGFQRAATSLDWTLPVTYSVMFIIVALVVGVAGFAIGSTWGFTIGFGSTAAYFGAIRDSSGYLVMPIWITIIVVMLALLIGFVWRTT